MLTGRTQALYKHRGSVTAGRFGRGFQRLRTHFVYRHSERHDRGADHQRALRLKPARDKVITGTNTLED